MVRRGVLLFVAASVACGISAVGQLEGDGEGTAGDASSTSSSSSSSSSGGAGDGGSDANGSDGAVPCDAGTGDATVVFLPSDGGACPSGTTEDTVATDPQAGAGACTCGACTPTADPSCNTGAISVDYGSNGTCATGSLSYANVPSDTCTDFGLGTVQQAAFEKWPTRAPTGGACTATSVPNPASVTTTSLRRCVVTAAEAACIPPSAAQRKCIESNGACGGDYPVAITYGSGGAVTCAPCACARGATKCIVEHFSDGACTQSRYMQDLNGTCTRTQDATNVRYFKVHPVGLTCVTTPGAPAVSLTGAKTLCCTP